MGLVRYYIRFVRAFNIIVAPLTDLLKKDAFQWGKEAQKAFNPLKKALINARVLILLDMHKKNYSRNRRI